MVMPKFLRDVEEKMGLPKLTDAAQILKNLPDEKRLKQIRAIINDIGKIKGSPDELAMAVALVKFIVEADMEHLNAVKDITGNLVKLMRYLPKDTLIQLPLGEIVEEIRKALVEA